MKSANLCNSACTCPSGHTRRRKLIIEIINYYGCMESLPVKASKQISITWFTSGYRFHMIIRNTLITLKSVTFRRVFCVFARNLLGSASRSYFLPWTRRLSSVHMSQSQTLPPMDKLVIPSPQTNINLSTKIQPMSNFAKEGRSSLEGKLLAHLPTISNT